MGSLQIPNKSAKAGRGREPEVMSYPKVECVSFAWMGVPDTVRLVCQRCEVRRRYTLNHLGRARPVVQKIIL